MERVTQHAGYLPFRFLIDIVWPDIEIGSSLHMHWREMKPQADEVDLRLVGGVDFKADISEKAQTSWHHKLGRHSQTYSATGHCSAHVNLFAPRPFLSDRVSWQQLLYLPNSQFSISSAFRLIDWFWVVRMSFYCEIVYCSRISSSSLDDVFDIGLIAIARNESRVVILAGQEIERTWSLRAKLNVESYPSSLHELKFRRYALSFRE